MYKLLNLCVIRLDDQAVIPLDESNRDYQDYLKWCAGGNVPQLPSLDEQRAAAKQALAAYRYQRETEGITWNGWPVSTDRESRSNLGNAYNLARDGYWNEGYKFADEVYRPVTSQQVIALALAVAAHVGQCYAREGEIAAQLDAATTPEALSWTW